MKHFVYLVLSLYSVSVMAQTQTIGTLINTVDSYDGYTLFAPMTRTTTYLIDNCGQMVNYWESSYRPGLSAYLLEDGSLLRTKNLMSPDFTGGGSAGGVQRFDWDGTLLWDYDLCGTDECSHHDVEYLPNGNVLIIVWEAKTEAEAIQAGKNPDNTPSSFWPDKIVEVEPLGSDSGTIVWEWHAWDHLIQDFDSSKDNYGVVADHPELIDINYPGISNSDWLHVNAVDYSPEFDQIALSIHNTNEIWIIDHSTTTQEAASHSGGTYGKGGDLLYRWGNPHAYDRGNPADKKFYGQHDVKWITEGSDVGKLMVFNNGQNRSPGVSYSTVDIIDPPVDGSGNYTPTASGQSYLPMGLYWSYESNPNTEFYASNISGAQRLPNDNTLICEGPSGHLFEVDIDGNLVWEYQTPVNANGPMDQGSTSTAGISIFRCTRYGSDYEGFNGRDLTPGDVIELNSTFSCELYSNTTRIEPLQQQEVQVVQNPSANFISIMNLKPKTRILIYDSVGRLVFQQNTSSDSVGMSTSFWPSGIYHVVLLTERNRVSKKLLIL